MRPARPALAALAATVAGAALAAPAQANLAAAGPVDPATQVPAWFQDGPGLKLGLCTDGPPYCLTTADEFNAPDGEGFFFNAGADLTINGTGNAKLVLAQEAVSPPSGPAAFMRVRVVLTGAAPNATYSVTHPFGSVTIQTDAIGGGRSTVDTGCSLAPCPAFDAALSGAMGPFLTWTPDPALPGGHIGDSVTPHTVTGGTNGNSFIVNGPGGASTNLFTVAGKLAGPAVPVVNVAKAMDFGATAPSAPVTRGITVTSFGVPDAGGASNVNFGPIGVSGPQATAFTLVGNDCTGRSLPSGAACTFTVQLKPSAAGNYSGQLDFSTSAGVSHVALNGVVAAAGVAGASARSRLTLRTLRTTHRMTRARVLRRGIRVTMRLPQGTEILKISVLPVRNGKVNRKPVWLGYRVTPSRPGLYRLRLDSRALRRRLRAGLYQLNITPGVSKHELGRTSTTRIRVTRG